MKKNMIKKNFMKKELLLDDEIINFFFWQVVRI
jgi:hypothetical protein